MWTWLWLKSLMQLSNHFSAQTLALHAVLMMADPSNSVRKKSVKAVLVNSVILHFTTFSLCPASSLFSPVVRALENGSFRLLSMFIEWICTFLRLPLLRLNLLGGLCSASRCLLVPAVFPPKVFFNADFMDVKVKSVYAVGASCQILSLRRALSRS